MKKQLRSLAKEMTWTPNENELEFALRVRHVQEKIAQTCQVAIPSYNVLQTVLQKDIPAYLSIARSYYRNLSVDLKDLKIESLQVPQAHAVVTAYVKATDAYDQRNDHTLALEFNLQKIEKKWLVTDAKEMQVLER
ncbi:hypothetical protein ASZ90_008022 [hydrocarbon metagenome]|uniref:Uncharacterized protein n=1 Tax=hydrocarbon metagenome TaxID=938273 RepID=A0A0W8FN17_9ZZZZ